MDKWNDAKQSEEKDRVKHDTTSVELTSTNPIDVLSRFNVLDINRNCLNREVVYSVA